MYVTVTPAYGRDYKSAKAARDDWKAGKDFILDCIMHPYDGKPTNKEQCDDEGLEVNIRYANLRKTCNA